MLQQHILDSLHRSSKRVVTLDPIHFDSFASKPMSDAEFNLLMLSKHPNWYDFLPQVESAMAAHEQWMDKRISAGWEIDEYGSWYAADGTPEHEWEGDLPEDLE